MMVRSAAKIAVAPTGNGAPRPGFCARLSRGAGSGPCHGR